MVQALKLSAALVLAASPAAAEVKSSSEHGFESVHVATVKSSSSQVYAALAKPGSWWSSPHTYSGDAKNMTLDPRAGGCFCETVPKTGATIEHGRIVYAGPGKALRLSSALGPLQAEGVSGALTWTIVATPEGTRITQSYVVGGFSRTPFATLAPLVDRVMGEQMSGLAKHLAACEGTLHAKQNC